MALAEDRSVYFPDFGVAATIGGNSVDVIFDNDFLASLGVDTSNPVALCDADDAAVMSNGDAVVIPAGDFSEAFTGTIANIQPDGTGFAILELEAS